MTQVILPAGWAVLYRLQCPKFMGANRRIERGFIGVDAHAEADRTGQTKCFDDLSYKRWSAKQVNETYWRRARAGVLDSRLFGEAADRLPFCARD
ncbi:MAG: hypothetical protein AMXMBFR4_04400 [Candidatus Hydrogenedentota bacterium]